MMGRNGRQRDPRPRTSRAARLRLLLMVAALLALALTLCPTSPLAQQVTPTTETSPPAVLSPHPLAATRIWPWPAPSDADLAAGARRIRGIERRCGVQVAGDCAWALAEARAAQVGLHALRGEPRLAEDAVNALLAGLPAEVGAEDRWRLLLGTVATRLRDVEMFPLEAVVRERVLALTIAQTGPESLETLRALLDAAWAGRKGGQARRARAQIDEALRLLDAAAEPDDLRVAEAKLLYASVRRGTNFLFAAQLALEEALRIGRVRLGEAAPLTASVHLEIAKSSVDRARLDTHLEACIEGLRQAGARSPVLADALTLRARETLRRTRDADLATRTDRARADLEEARAILEQSAVPRPASLARTLDAWAELVLVGGDIEASVALRLESLGLFEASVGANDEDAMNMQISLAWTLSELRRHEEAVALGSWLVEAQRLEVNNWGLGTKGRALALIAAYAGEEDLARSGARLALEIHTRRGMSAPRGLDERSAMTWMKRGRQSVDEALGVLRRPEDVPLLWDTIVRWTGAIRNATMSRHWARLADPASQSDAARLAAVRAELSARIASGDDAAQITSLAEERDRLERAISLRVRNLLPDLESVGLVEICAALRPGEALVQFVQYRRIDPYRSSPISPREDALLAFVATAATCATPTRVELGPTAAVEQATGRWHDELAVARRGGLRARLTRAGEALRALVWDPVATAVGSSTRIFLVPDGPVGVVPFAALPGPDGGVLLDRLGFSYLDSARDLALWERLRPAPGTGALLVGDVNFGAVDPAQAGRGPCAVGPFGALPGSRRELQRVAAQLRGANVETLRLTGDAATVAGVMAAAPGRRFLHLATHGFAPGAPCLASASALAPLSLTGLALAGANRPTSTTQDHDDGLLSAEEIVGLDLRGTELVVLSSCGSALGAASAGEGLLGLRRALLVAGARSVIGTLGDVDDEATAALMRDLYRALLQGQPAPDALWAAQRARLAAHRRRGATAEEDWGLFVVTGR